jgi:hypothetical protein
VHNLCHRYAGGDGHQCLRAAYRFNNLTNAILSGLSKPNTSGIFSHLKLLRWKNGAFIAQCGFRRELLAIILSHCTND